MTIVLHYYDGPVGATGNNIDTVVPLPTVLRISRWPRCRSTICLTRL